MRKLAGLRFLQKHFWGNCVDCVFLSGNQTNWADILPVNQCKVWRIRSGKTIGAESCLPQGTFYSEIALRRFVEEWWGEDPLLEFVVHRVNEEFFLPKFVGSVTLINGALPVMVIDFQCVTNDLLANIDVGKRPRDWDTTLVITYEFMAAPAKIHYKANDLDLENLKNPISFLYRMGRKTCTILDSTPMPDLAIRFNIYHSGKIILDDCRSSMAA